MFISIQRYAFEWLSFPIVILLLAVALFGVLRPTLRALIDARRNKTPGQGLRLVKPAAGERPDILFTLAVLALFGVTLASSFPWPGDAKLMPWAVAWTGIAFAAMHLSGRFVAEGAHPATRPEAAQPPGGHGETTDLVGTIRNLPAPVMLARSGNFLCWLVVYMILTLLVGLLPAMFVFLIGYMRLQGRESWKLSPSPPAPWPISSSTGSSPWSGPNPISATGCRCSGRTIR
jgi:hypothetical protein